MLIYSRQRLGGRVEALSLYWKEEIKLIAGFLFTLSLCQLLEDLGWAKPEWAQDWSSKRAGIECLECHPFASLISCFLCKVPREWLFSIHKGGGGCFLLIGLQSCMWNGIVCLLSTNSFLFCYKGFPSTSIAAMTAGGSWKGKSLTFPILFF